MEKMKQECKVKKSLKIWQGVLTLLVSAVILFVAAPILLSPFGMYGSLLGELLLFGVAVGAVLLFHGDLREVFPLKKPHFSGIAGTILIWVGTFLCEMVLLLILSLFFPDQILEVNDGLSSSIAAGPFLLSFVTVAISPAICEEALFRGTFVSSLRGRLGKWAVLLISGCIFGMFHGDVFRFFPTAIGGVMMGYLLWETGNMCYNMLFHFINNALPVILLYAMQGVYSRMELYMEAQTLAQGAQDMLPAVGMYLMMASAAPGAAFIGDFFLYRKLSDSCKNTGVSHEIIPVRQTGTGNRSDSGVFVFICSGSACFFDFNRENVINRRLTEQRKMFIIVLTI